MGTCGGKSAAAPAGGGGTRAAPRGAGGAPPPERPPQRPAGSCPPAAAAASAAPPQEPAGASGAARPPSEDDDAERAAALRVLRFWRNWRARAHRSRHALVRHTYGGPPPERIFEAGVLCHVWKHLDMEEEQQSTAGGDSDDEGSPVSPFSPQMRASAALPPDGRWGAADASALVGLLTSSEEPDLDPAYVQGVLRAAELLFAEYQTVERMPLGTEPGSKVVVVGDLHGQLEDLMHILSEHGMPSSGAGEAGEDAAMRASTTCYVFNGDLVDRGHCGVEVLTLVCVLALAFRDSVRVNRGNHEDMAQARKYGFRAEVTGIKFPPRDGEAIWGRAVALFHALPLCCVVADTILAVHGGPPGELCTLAEINGMKRRRRIPMRSPLQEDKRFVDLLWSDPHDPLDDEKEMVPNTGRGAGVLFGAPHTRAFLELNPPLTHLVRSHEPPTLGWLLQQRDQLYTVFSASDYRGSSSNRAAVLVVTRTHDGAAQIRPATWTSDAAQAVQTGFQYRSLAPRPVLSSEDRLEWTRDEVVRRLRERISLRKDALLRGFNDADENADGLLSHPEWEAVMRRVLIPVAWLHLRRYLVPLREAQRTVRVPSASMRGEAAELALALSDTPARTAFVSHCSGEAARCPLLFTGAKVTAANGQAVGGEAGLGPLSAAAAGEAPITLQVAAHCIPYVDMLLHSTCAFEDDLARRWSPFFFRWLLDRASNGQGKVTEEHGRQLFGEAKHSAPGHMTYLEFGELVTSLSQVASEVQRTPSKVHLHTSASLSESCHFQLYEWLDGMHPPRRGLVTRAAWDSGVARAVSGERLESGRVTVPAVIRTFCCADGERRERPFLMWDVWIVRSLRLAFSEMCGVLDAFRFLDADRDTVIGEQDLARAVQALRLDRGSAEQWYAQVVADEAIHEKELAKLFGHVPVERRDGPSWLQVSHRGSSGWVGAGEVEPAPGSGGATAAYRACEGARPLLRSEPSPSPEHAQKLPAGAELQLLGAVYQVRVWPLSRQQVRALIRRIQRASGPPVWSPGDPAEVFPDRRDAKWYHEGTVENCTVEKVHGASATVRWDGSGECEDLPLRALRRRCQITYQQFVRAFFSTASLDAELGDPTLAPPQCVRRAWFADDAELWRAWRKARPTASGEGHQRDME